MAKKVIALIRTSTVTQEVESQKQEVINFIKLDGVKEENIIVVGHAGASAIKVDEAYKRNLNTVYKLIEGGNISGVYAWAIDRIGRNEEILMEFKNRLIKNNIQLVIKEPTLRLLNNDGSVNQGVELAFALFATMAKQEMETKKARFSRAKKRNAEQGRYNGGKIHFGYSVVDGKFCVNESEAEIVKLLFNLYNSGQYSASTLTKELNNRGYKMRGKTITQHFVLSMLKSTAFIGYTTFNGVKRTYPQIISKDLFESVQRKLIENTKTTQTQHTHLASKLIVCQQCGKHYVATNRSYMCVNHKKGECQNNDYINVEWVDIAAWHVAKTIEINYLYDFTESKAEEAKQQIEVNLQKINTLQQKINKIEQRRKRIALMFINDEITEQEQAKQSAKIKADVAEYNAQIVDFEEQNIKLAQIAEFDKEGTLIHLGRLPISGIYEDAQKAYKITHKHIKSITIEPYEYKGKKQKMINVNTVLGNTVRFLYIAKSKIKENGTPIKLFVQNGDDFKPLIATTDFVPNGIDI